MSPTKREGRHIGFSADPGRRRRRRRDIILSTILLESVGGILPYLHGYIIRTSQRAEFWFLDHILKITGGLRLLILLRQRRRDNFL